MHALDCCAEADTLPRWVLDAVLQILVGEVEDGVGDVGRWCRTHRRDVIDYVRAEAIRSARAHGFSWEDASAFAAEYLAPTPAGGATAAAMMKSWRRFHIRGTEIVEPGRFFVTAPGRVFADEFTPSPEHAAEVRAKFVARVKQAGRWRDVPPSVEPERPPRSTGNSFDLGGPRVHRTTSVVRDTSASSRSGRASPQLQVPLVARPATKSFKVARNSGRLFLWSRGGI